MTKGTDSTLNTAMRKLLRPLVRLLLRNGVAYADFALLVRQAFVDVAADDFDLPGRKQSVSRISVLTGINRKEVKRLLEEPRDNSDSSENNRAAKVVSGWMRDEDYLSKSGKPDKLTWGDTESTKAFESLVKKYSGDMPARSVLDELIRVGAVTLHDNRQVELTATGYVPFSSNEELLRISGESVTDLLNTIDFNLAQKKDHTRLQLSVAYNDVPANGVDAFRQISQEKSLELLTSMDHFLSQQDRSINKEVAGEGRYRTGLGIYFFEEDLLHTDNSEPGSNTDGVKKKGVEK